MQHSSIIAAASTEETLKSASETKSEALDLHNVLCKACMTSLTDLQSAHTSAEAEAKAKEEAAKKAAEETTAKKRKGGQQPKAGMQTKYNKTRTHDRVGGA